MNATTRLLMVEDDASIGEPLAEALLREGFIVTWVRTGDAALEETESSDLVLLDLGLPDLDGVEVCRRIRAASRVPIIVLTARDDEVERVLLLEMGADDYVLKPFGFRELVARIRVPVLHVAAGAPEVPVEALVARSEAQLARVARHRIVVPPRSRHFVMYDAPDFLWSEVDAYLREAQ